MDFQRKMLDELMGANRNVSAREKPAPSAHLSDEEVSAGPRAPFFSSFSSLFLFFNLFDFLVYAGLQALSCQAVSP